MIRIFLSPIFMLLIMGVCAYSTIQVKRKVGSKEERKKALYLNTAICALLTVLVIGYCTHWFQTFQSLITVLMLVAGLIGLVVGLLIHNGTIMLVKTGKKVVEVYEEKKADNDLKGLREAERVRSGRQAQGTCRNPIDLKSQVENVTNENFVELKDITRDEVSDSLDSLVKITAQNGSILGSGGRTVIVPDENADTTDVSIEHKELEFKEDKGMERYNAGTSHYEV